MTRCSSCDFVNHILLPRPTKPLVERITVLTGQNNTPFAFIPKFQQSFERGKSAMTSSNSTAHQTVSSSSPCAPLEDIIKIHQLLDQGMDWMYATRIVFEFG